MRYTMVLAAAAVLGTATACTDDDPIEAQMGSASAVITDDPATASAPPADPQDDQATGLFTGTFTGDARVAIRAEGGMWVDLGSLADATVALQSTGDATTIHGDAAVPVGTYTQVRLTLADAEARVAAGAILGGLTLTSDVRIDVGSDGRLVIEKTVEPFAIDTHAHARILFDLNSEAWVHEHSVEEESADDGEVRDHTTATRTVVSQA